MDTLGLATSLYRHTRKIKGYSHPPLWTNPRAYFTLTREGKRFEITVREISVDEEIAKVMAKVSKK